MRPTRRAVLAGAGAALLAGRPGAAAPPPIRIFLASLSLAEGARPAAVFAFDGAAPGPELRGPAGERFSVGFANDLPHAVAVSAIGLRGQRVRIDVASGATAALSATPPDAGTFWYAAEDRADPRARALVGALIVDEPVGEAPEVDRDLALVLDVWPLTAGGASAVAFFSTDGAAAVVNGAAGLVEPAHPGERLRLRLINAAHAHVFRPRLQGWRGWLVALDGQPLALVESFDGIVLAPGQRADLIADAPDEEGVVVAILDDADPDAAPLLRLIADGEPLPPLTDPPAPLPSNALPPLDMSDARDLGWEALEASAAPEIAVGQTVRLNIMVGDAAEMLAVEGCVLRRLNGEGAPVGPWRDVLLMEPGSVPAVAFAPVAPGSWRATRRPLGGVAREGRFIAR
jgi:FtsP/CotA-like multicopper oxidase with cupredoxin domain